MKKKLINTRNKDPFETICWNLTAYDDPMEVIQDVFSNDDYGYFRTTMQHAFLALLHGQVLKGNQSRELFRVYQRVNALLLVGHHFYKIHKRYFKKKQEVLNQGLEEEHAPQHASNTLPHEDSQYCLYRLFRMNKMSYWKSEWSYFMLYALGEHDFQHAEEFYSLNFFTQLLLETLHDMYHSE